MIFGTILAVVLISTTNLTITEPVDGETYDGDWLPLRAIVENENEVPDSVHYSLNGQAYVLIPRLNTDWYTYMANDCRTGYSESPAPYDNTILWTAQISGTHHEFVSPVVVDGRVYYASEEDEIAYCLDAATGTEIWRYEDIGGAIDDAMHVDDGRAYLASDSIWCLDALTGEKIWTFGDFSNYFSGPPVPYQGYVFVSSLRLIHCLDGFTGEEIWKSDSIRTASGMTLWNDMLFVAGAMPMDSSFYSLDIETGGVVWKTKTGGHWDSSPVLVDSTIYIGVIYKGLCAIDPFSGSYEIIWGSEESFIESTPSVYDDIIYFGDRGYMNADNAVYAVNRFSGDLLWEYILPNSDYLHASTGLADGLVFWGDHDASPPEADSTALIHAVDCQTGTEVWHYTIEEGRGIFSSPAIVDGVMYIAATDGNLYAFGKGLKYTYREIDFYADVGSNELIVTSWDNGIAVSSDTINFTVTQTGILLEPSRQLDLSATPNPIRNFVSISFELPAPGLTTIEIFDLSGRLVISLTDSELIQGTHSVQWNGFNQIGEEVSAGLYLCRIKSGGVIETTGMCLLR